MKISQPEKPWKNSSATFDPKNWYRIPTEAMRRALVKIVTGMEETTRTALFQKAVRK